MIFDSHAHIVSDDQQRYPPAPLSGSVREGDLDDPITAERLLRLLDTHGVERALAVQRAHIYGYDNSYVVDAAEKYPDRLQALCAIDANDRDAPARIRHWVGDRGAVGIRLTEPFKGADTSWLDSPAALDAWGTAAELGVSVRVHLYRWNRAACLPAIAALLPKVSATKVVIDHLSNMHAEQGPADYGLDAPLEALAAYPQVFLLFSTINLAKLAAAGQPAAPVIERVVDRFGAARVLWGSDIGQSKGSYQEMRALAEAAVASLDAEARRQVLYATGRSLYG